MPCLLVLLVLAFPRIILLCMWFFTPMLNRAFNNLLIPVLGFLFLPITTIVYTWMTNEHMALQGVNLVILVIAVLLDAGSHSSGGGYYRRRRA
jgi:hypothetical protein